MINTFVSFFFLRGSDYSLSSIFISLAVSIYTFFCCQKEKSTLHLDPIKHNVELSLSLSLSSLSGGILFWQQAWLHESLSQSQSLLISRSSHTGYCPRSDAVSSCNPSRARSRSFPRSLVWYSVFLCFVSYDLFFLYIFLLSICFSFVFAVGANVLFALYYWVKILFCFCFLLKKGFFSFCIVVDNLCSHFFRV